MVVVVLPTTLVIMGDSLLYVVLPARAAEFGLSATLGLSVAFWLGLALSINRFVRLASNAFAASIYRRFGLRVPFVSAVALGALTTLAYAFSQGVMVLLLARALWGVSFSFLRLASYLTAFEIGSADTRGRLLGFYNSGQRLGSLIAVTGGAVLADLTTRGVTFTAIAAVGVIGVLVATRAPSFRPGALVTQGRADRGGSQTGRVAWSVLVSRLPAGASSLRWPMLSISFLRFATAFAANGLVIATVAPYLEELVVTGSGSVFGITVTVLTLAGLLVGVRWVSDLALSIPLGHASDRFGRRPAITVGLAFMLAALGAMGTFSIVEVVVIAMPVLFVASVGVNTALDASMGETAPDEVRPAAMGRYATWQDLGSALGPLLGFLIAERLGFQTGYVIAAVLLAGGLANYLAVTRRAGRSTA